MGTSEEYIRWREWCSEVLSEYIHGYDVSEEELRECDLPEELIRWARRAREYVGPYWREKRRGWWAFFLFYYSMVLALMAYIVILAQMG